MQAQPARIDRTRQSLVRTSGRDETRLCLVSIIWTGFTCQNKKNTNNAGTACKDRPDEALPRPNKRRIITKIIKITVQTINEIKIKNKI
jgi:hypothetical protein